MTRIGLVTLLGLAAATCLGSGIARYQTSSNLTVTIQATSVEKALKQLSNLSGIPLAASRQTADEIVCLKVTNATLASTMTKLAEAIDGSWKQEADGYRLVRTSDQLRREEQTEFQSKVSRIRQGLKKRLATLTQHSAWSATEANALASRLQTLIKGFNPKQAGQQYYQQTRQISELAPFGRATTALLSELNPAELASIPAEERFVWSSQPTRTQHPFPSGATSILSKLLTDQEIWSTTLENKHVTAPTINGVTYWVGDLGELGSHPGSGPITTFLLTAQRWNSTSGLMLELTGYDSKGLKVNSAQCSIEEPDEDYMKAWTSSPVSAGEKVVRFDTELIHQLAPSQSPGTKRIPLSPSLLQKLTHPETYDPLSLLVSPSLFQVADTQGNNLVACLSDNSYFVTLIGNEKEIGVGRFLQRLRASRNEVFSQDGWTIIRPSELYGERTLRADRRQLGEYLRASYALRVLPLESKAKFALALPSSLENPLPAVLQTCLNIPADEAGGTNLLRFYGLLTTEQKSQMRSGGMSLGSLTEAQRILLEKMVYGMSSPLQYDPINPQTADWSLFYAGIYHEPTVSLPNGIPQQGIVKLSVDNSYAISLPGYSSASMNTPDRTLDAAGLAWQKYAQEREDLFPWMNVPWQRMDFNKLQFGRKSHLVFTFKFTQELSLIESLVDKSAEKFRPIAFGDLPADFLKQVNDAYNGLKEAYANSKPGDLGGGVGTAPPPLSLVRIPRIKRNKIESYPTNFRKQYKLCRRHTKGKNKRYIA